MLTLIIGIALSLASGAPVFPVSVSPVPAQDPGNPSVEPDAPRQQVPDGDGPAPTARSPLRAAIPGELDDAIFLPASVSGITGTGAATLVLDIGDPWLGHTPLTIELALLGNEPRISRHHLRGDVEASVAASLATVGLFDEAEDMFLQSYQVRARAHGLADPLTQDAVKSLIRLYEAWGKTATARRYRDLLR